MTGKICPHCGNPLDEDATYNAKYHPACAQVVIQEKERKRRLARRTRYSRGCIVTVGSFRYHFTPVLGKDYIALKLAGWTVPPESRQIHIRKEPA